MLHLDIFSEAVHTIEDALRLFSAPEALEGYRTSAGKVICFTVCGYLIGLLTVSVKCIISKMIFRVVTRDQPNNGPHGPHPNNC